MKNKKLRVGILFGGKSTEHEISLRSTKNIIEAIDKNKYKTISIMIDKNGKWPITFEKLKRSVDVVFPVLHGPFGEDGTVQGLLKLMEIPFIGASILGSAVGMDKEVMKKLLREAKIPIGKFLIVKKDTVIDYDKIIKKLGLPFFVKPANAGSSVGINKVSNEKNFKKATKEAFQFDLKILLEEYIEGREIECSVLGNNNPISSLPGEIIIKDKFYSYKAKYLNKNSTELKIPADLSKVTTQKIQKMAVEVFKTLYCEGFGRVDFFVKKNGKIVVNEINTIPGFTSISMYPKLWEISGISYTKLIDKLIELALERFKNEQKIKTSYV